MTNDTDIISNPQPALADWTAKAEAHERLVAQIFPANKNAVFGALAAAGISRVLVTFDGYGDSGQIESIEATAAQATVPLPPDEIEFATAVWGQTEPERGTVTIADAVERLVYHLLERTHGGWCNNEGGWGEFVFDVAARTITLDLNERYVSTESYSHEF